MGLLAQREPRLRGRALVEVRHAVWPTFDRICRLLRTHSWLRRGLTNAVAGSPLCPKPLRRAVLTAYGLQLSTSQIMERCFFGGPDIRLGHNVFVNVGCIFDNGAAIDVGAHSHLAHGVQILTSTHEIGGPGARASTGYAAPVQVGSGCWLGSGVTLLPGVVVGDGCVVAAGAVVTEECLPNGLYAGVPARRVRDLDVSGRDPNPPASTQA